MDGRQEIAQTPWFQPRRFTHANLYVSDLDRSMDFYSSVVGLEEVYRRPPIKGGFLSTGSTHHDIGMVEITSPLCKTGAPGLNHLAFEVESEAALVEGYRRVEAPEEAFPRTVDHDITRSLYGTDPDGNMIEIYADMHKDWRARRAGEVNMPTPNWSPGEPAPTSDRNYHIDPEIRRVEAAAFHPRRITHATLVVDDYAGALEYYANRIGLEPVLGGPGSAFAILGGACGTYDLALFRAHEGRAPGLHHIGFEAWDDEDLSAAAARLAGLGLSPEVEINHASRRAVYLRDPDGIRIQFFVDRAGPAAGLGEADEELALFLA